jgi:hypothetical protein
MCHLPAAKQEAAIKDFLHKYDVSTRHANLTAENAQLAERLATLEVQRLT